MPAISRQGDSVLSPDGSGHKCRMPLKTSVGEVNSSEVYVNGILIVVQGNKVAPHTKSGCTLDESTLSTCSSKVFAGNKGVGRIGDEYSDNLITQGSPTVFAG
jgi:uncharacterized Zn-binding protein involved in type VI secretion